MTRTKLILSAVALLTGGSLIWMWLGRGSSEAPGIHRVDADADIPPAAVARVDRHNVGSTLSISGEFKPFQDVDIHAKVAGYIRQIYVDVVDRGKGRPDDRRAGGAGACSAVDRRGSAVRAAQEASPQGAGRFAACEVLTTPLRHSAYTRLKQQRIREPVWWRSKKWTIRKRKTLETEGQTASAEAEIAAAKQQLEMAQANQKQYARWRDTHALWRHLLG